MNDQDLKFELECMLETIQGRDDYNVGLYNGIAMCLSMIDGNHHEYRSCSEILEL